MIKNKKKMISKVEKIIVMVVVGVVNSGMWILNDVLMNIMEKEVQYLPVLFAQSIVAYNSN